MVGLRRRTFLLAAGGALLAGCGGSGEDEIGLPGGQAVANDARVLQAALDAQRRELDHYEAALEDAEGERRLLLARFAAIEREHVRLVERAIGRAGGRPAERHGADVDRTLAEVERAAVDRWIDLVPKLSQPSLRRLAGALATVDAQQAAALERA